MGGDGDASGRAPDSVRSAEGRARLPGEAALDAEMVALEGSLRAHSLASFVCALIAFVVLVSRPASAPVSLPTAALGAAFAYIGIGLRAWRSEWLVLALGLVLSAASAVRVALIALPPELRSHPVYALSLLVFIPWAIRCFIVYVRMRLLRVELARTRAGGVPRIGRLG